MTKPPSVLFASSGLRIEGGIACMARVVARALDEEVRTLDVTIARYVRATAPCMLERPGIGPEVASALLVAAPSARKRHAMR